MHTHSSVQHSLEERLKDCQEQLAAAQAQISQPRPPSVGTRRELAALQRDNAAHTIGRHARRHHKNVERKQQNTASSIIQASYRGKKSRKKSAETQGAAVKIQASFRGKKSRTQGCNYNSGGCSWVADCAYYFGTVHLNYGDYL